VTKAVVDVLEPVEVEEENSNRAMVASRTSNRGFQNIVEHRPIGETRKVIVERRSRRDFSNPLSFEARLAFSVEFSDESFNFVD